jgi:hypothetical protein
MKKNLLTLACLLMVGTSIFAQNVGINNNDPQAALDLLGRLRMRALNLDVSSGAVNSTAIHGYYSFTGSPASPFTATIPLGSLKGTHLVVGNNTTQSGTISGVTTLLPNEIKYLLRGDGVWLTIYSSLTSSSFPSKIQDADGDTRVETEQSLDEDKLRFTIQGSENMSLEKNATNGGYLKLTDNGKNVFIGENTGTHTNTTETGPPNAITTKGSYNIGIGTEALRDNTTASHTVAIGWRALATAGNGTTHPSSIANTAVGDRAMELNAEGSHNTAIGAGAMLSTGGSFNVAVGSASLTSNNGSLNTAIGHEALEASAMGGLNTAVGTASLNKNSTGGQNVAMGVYALRYNRTGSENVAIGYKALMQHESDIEDMPLLAASRDGIVAVGAHALEKNGQGATVLEHGSQNTAVGTNALNSNTIGYSNTALGNYALVKNIFGANNIGIGANALYSNETGDQNVALGNNALFANISAGGNIGLGNEALRNHNSGNNNVAIGSLSFHNNIEGSGNVGLGFNAGRFETGSNKLYIENSDANKDNALIYGEFDNNVLQLNAKTTVNGFTKLGGTDATVPSIKMKELTMTTGTGATGVSLPTQGIHGLDATKILSVSVLVTVNAAVTVPPSYDADPQLKYNYYVGTTNIVIQNQSSSCAMGNFICNKTAKVLITYKE